MKTYIISALALQFGFTVIGKGYKKRHYCFTKSEALQWVACYDDGASMYYRGNFVATKGCKAPTVDKVF